jgi:Xaa-Pro dipeptidase
VTSRREFLAQAALASAASLTVTRDAIGVVPRWWTSPATDPASGVQDVPDRLPVAWYRGCVQRLQAKLAEQGLDGILLKDQWDIIYVAGYFHTTTERPVALWVPRDGEPTLFVPGLDRDLVATWWVKDAEFYFDYPQAEVNGDPRAGSVLNPSGTVNLWAWMMKSLDRRGFGNKTIALDWEPGPTQARVLQEALPSARFSFKPDLVMGMRIIKTPEEVALTQRAIDYSDRMLEFCRTYVMQHGTRATDFEVHQAAERFGTELVMRDVAHDGRAHSAAGVSVMCSCRTGVATAYPHPNQFFYERIRRGQAIQFSGIMVRIGGYGGEGYRACHIRPMTPEQARLWEVHNEMTLAQQAESRPGVECRQVASKVLEIARRAGMEQYLYHRPAHGAGMEGHQPPYVSLGDATVMRENMMFSNEAGLYNPAGGYGYNHSNNLLITAGGAQLMNKTPLTKEWCFLKI